MNRFWLTLAFVVLSGSAFAQTPPADVTNPSAVQWTPSTDHATIDSYVLDIVSPAGAVIQTLDMGKPTPDAQNVCQAPLNVQPVAFANGYTVQLRARAGSTVSTNAISENKFDRRPGSPSKPVLK